MAMETEVKVYSLRPSAYAQVVLIALREKGISFDVIDVDLMNKPKGLLEANPVHKKVPTIIHNGQAVAESLVILQYLEEAWPSKVHLLPEDAYGRSKMRFWADYTCQFYSKFVPNVFAPPDSPMRAAADTVVADGLKTLEEAMLSFSSDGPFFTGEKFGYMDVVLAPITCILPVQEHFCKLTVPGPHELPRFYKWLKAVKAHPSVHATLPSAEEKIAIVSKIKERIAAAAAKSAK